MMKGESDARRQFLVREDMVVLVFVSGKFAKCETTIDVTYLVVCKVGSCKGPKKIVDLTNVSILLRIKKLPPPPKKIRMKLISIQVLLFNNIINHSCIACLA